MIAAKKELEERIAKGRPQPSPAPRRLPLDAIETCEEVFQLRRLSRRYSEHFSRELARALKHQTRPLEAVSVYWIGDAWLCVDGHHRLAAYRDASYSKPIPVTVIRGSLDEAMLAAASGNSQDKLLMSPFEKREAAWRLSLTTKLSKANIAEAANVSERTVANMRRLVRDLMSERKLPAEAVAQLSWSKAKFELKYGRQRTEEESLSARDARAEELAMRLRRHFGQSLNVNPSILAQALYRYNARFPGQLQAEFEEQGLLNIGEDGEVERSFSRRVEF